MSLNILDKIRNQTCVYWAPAVDAQGRVVPDPSGQLTFAAPVELAVYWQDTNEFYADPATGNQRRSRAVVYTDPDVPNPLEGGFLFRGTLASVPTNLRNKPKSVFRAYQIQRADAVPNVRGDRTMRRVWL